MTFEKNQNYTIIFKKGYRGPKSIVTRITKEFPSMIETSLGRRFKFSSIEEIIKDIYPENLLETKYYVGIRNQECPSVAWASVLDAENEAKRLLEKNLRTGRKGEAYIFKLEKTIKIKQTVDFEYE